MASASSRRLCLKRSSASSARRACCSTWLLSHAICAASDDSDRRLTRFVPVACRLVDPSRPVVLPDCSHTLLISHMSQQPPRTPPVPQYLLGTTGRTDLPNGYARVHRGTRTTRPRDLPGAGQRVSPMLGILGQASTCRSTDRARAG